MNIMGFSKSRYRKHLRASLQRALAVLLALQMTFGSLPVYAAMAFAEELADQPAETAVLEETGDEQDDPAAAADPGEDQPEAPAEDSEDQQLPTEEGTPEPADDASDIDGDQQDETDATADDADVAAAAKAEDAADGEKDDESEPNGPGPLRFAVPGTIDTVDTKSLGITINLFDYVADDTTTNSYDDDPTQAVTGQGINTGKSRTNQLKFYGTGDGTVTSQAQIFNAGGSINPGNGINQFTGVARWNEKTTTWGYDFYTLQYANQGIVQQTLSGSDTDDPATRFPLLNTNASDKTTNYLFDPGTQPADPSSRTVYEDVNHLFYLENAGTASERLVYDSNEHYAYYNKTGENAGDFTVYDRTYDRKGGSKSYMKVGFFPFDEWWTQDNVGPEINPNDGTTQVNHHLGLTLNFPFTMPYEGRVHTAEDDAPLVFDFSGDDDMWVFVDGKLVLDIGGIHQPVKGTINFETGVVQISSGTINGPVYFLEREGFQIEHRVDQASFSYLASGIAETPDQHGDIVYMWDVYGFEGGDRTKPILVGDSDPIVHGILGNKYSPENRAGSDHTLQAFYLERGGCDSNLKITTNIHLMSKHSVTVSKDWAAGVPETDRTPIEVELIRRETPRAGGDPTYTLIDTVTLQNGAWSKTWGDLPDEGYVGDTYCDFTYLVREVPNESWSPSYSGSGSLSVEQISYNSDVTGAYYPVDSSYDAVTITNEPIVTKVTVEKQWTDASTVQNHPAIWVQLYKDGVAVGDPVQLSGTTLTHEFPNLDPTGHYTVREGTYEGGAFTPTITFTRTEGGQTFVYTQQSLTYYDAGSTTARTEEYLDGTVHPDAGRAVIVNEPVKTDIGLIKVDADSEGGDDPIGGVSFQLLRDAGTADVYEKDVDTVPVADGSQSTFTTAADGTVSLPTLDPGTYWLLETATPDGYVLRDSNHPIGIKIGNDGVPTLLADTYDSPKTQPTIEDSDGDGAYELTVRNVRAYSLPSTGGPGTYPFLALGAFAAAYAVARVRDAGGRSSRRGSVLKRLRER